LTKGDYRRLDIGFSAMAVCAGGFSGDSVNAQ
jgi:hypothetical protein